MSDNPFLVFAVLACCGLAADIRICVTVCVGLTVCTGIGVDSTGVITGGVAITAAVGVVGVTAAKSHTYCKTQLCQCNIIAIFWTSKNLLVIVKILKIIVHDEFKNSRV